MVVPVQTALEELARKIGRDTQDYVELCRDEYMIQVASIPKHNITDLLYRLCWIPSPPMLGNTISRNLRFPGL